MGRSKIVAVDAKISFLIGRLLHGIIDYANGRSDWKLLFNVGPLSEGRNFRSYEELPRLGARGLLTYNHVDEPDWAERVKALGLPVVLMGGEGDADCRKFHGVARDYSKAAEMVAQYFLDRGIRHFACLAQSEDANAELAGRAFARTALSRGCGCSWFDASTGESGSAKTGHEFHPVATAPRKFSKLSLKAIIQWLKSLPRPIALLAVPDKHAQMVISCCDEAGIDIPGSVAVMGMGNNELLCLSRRPPLSSIDMNACRVGYEAARLLDRLMDGEPPPDEPVKIAPRTIVTRASSDVLATADSAVVRAVVFIRKRLADPIGLPDIVKESGLACTTLEQRFHKALDRTVIAELLRQRLERAKQLMLETDLSLSQIARLSGFRPTYFHNVFAAKVGTPPAQWRRERQ